MLSALLTVSSPAAHANLTTRDAVKEELSINLSDGSLNPWIDRRIAVNSGRVCAFLGITAAQDGSRTLGKETLVETIRLRLVEPPELMLSRWPLASIASVVEDDLTLDGSADYEFDGPAGLLFRLYSDERVRWCAEKIVVTYLAGYLLPQDAARNLPEEIEAAVIELVAHDYAARGRDPYIRQETNVGIASFSYAPPASADDLPESVVNKIARYRRIVLA